MVWSAAATIGGSEDGSVVMDRRTTTRMLWSTVASMASIGGRWGDGVISGGGVRVYGGQ
jgi:hypothetical protein